MNRHPLLFTQLCIVALVATLHVAGSVYSLYWRFPWFDIPAHFLGGAWAGTFVVWVWMRGREMPSLAVCITGVLAIGIAWEFLEMSIGMMEFPADALDSMKDLAMDALGGLAAWFLARRITRT